MTGIIDDYDLYDDPLPSETGGTMLDDIFAMISSFFSLWEQNEKNEEIDKEMPLDIVPSVSEGKGSSYKSYSSIIPVILLLGMEFSSVAIKRSAGSLLFWASWMLFEALKRRPGVEIALESLYMRESRALGEQLIYHEWYRISHQHWEKRLAEKKDRFW